MDATRGDDASRRDSVPPPAAEQAAAREAKRRAALEDFNKRTQRTLAVILLIFGAVGLISFTIISNRAPRPRSGESPREINQALYKASVEYLGKLDRQKTQLQAEAKRRPKENAAQLHDVDEKIEMTKALLENLEQDLKGAK